MSNIEDKPTKALAVCSLGAGILAATPFKMNLDVGRRRLQGLKLSIRQTPLNDSTTCGPVGVVLVRASAECSVHGLPKLRLRLTCEPFYPESTTSHAINTAL